VVSREIGKAIINGIWGAYVVSVTDQNGGKKADTKKFVDFAGALLRVGA